MASKKYTKLITIDVIQLQEDYFKISFVFNDEISLHVDMAYTNKIKLLRYKLNVYRRIFGCRFWTR